MMTKLKYWLYRWHQWRHTRPKRRKDPTFRVAPALAVIHAECSWLGSGSRVLDLGPRHGREVELLESAGWHVDALDLFPTTPGIRRGDMHHLPYPDNSFDLVFASHVFEHAYDFAQVAAEVGRVLRPGGAVWVAVPTGFVPNRHDRIAFQDAGEITAEFRAVNPETIWTDSRPTDLRLLFRCWKEPLGGHPRRFLVGLTHPLHCRNWAASGTLQTLTKHGHAVTLLVPTALVSALRAQVPLATVLPWEPYGGGRVVRWLRRGPLRTASYVARAARGERPYAHKLSLRRGGRARVQIAGCRLIQSWADAEQVAAWVEARLPVPPALRCLVRIHDCVVVPTFLHTGAEDGLIRAAHAAKLPVVAQAATWDCLVSKGGFLARPDWLLVWGEQSATHAIQRHGFQLAQVRVTGPPQFDMYAQAASAPGAPLGILIAGTSLQYWDDEVAVVTLLDSFFPAGRIHYKPHPRRWHRFVWMHVPSTVRIHEWGQSYLDCSPATLQRYRWLLDQVACVVTAWSTLALEGALLGKPVLLVGFGRGVGPYGHWDHIRPILDWPGVVVCPTREALIRAVEQALAGEVATGGLRAHAQQIAHCLDGHAAARTVAALEEIAAIPNRRTLLPRDRPLGDLLRDGAGTNLGTVLI